MSEGSSEGSSRRSSLLVLLVLVILLCLCLATPSLARTSGLIGDLAKPVAGFIEPIVCKVPQISESALFCPGGRSK